jgi:hypothetical protein
MGVYGEGDLGVAGVGQNEGVFGHGVSNTPNTSGIGVRAHSQYYFGIVATSGTHVGLYVGSSLPVFLSTPSRAGEFYGDVLVTGYLNKPGGGFKIADPRNPANKYLSHSFVESADMLVVFILHTYGRRYVM